MPDQRSRNMVQVLHTHGISHRIIAKTLDIDPKTLRKHYRDTLRDAHEQVEAAMGAAIVTAANRGAWGAARYWLTVHGDPKWRVAETHLLGGAPNTDPLRVDLNQMSEDEIVGELEAIRERRRIAAGARALAEAMPKRSNGVGH